MRGQSRGAAGLLHQKLAYLGIGVTIAAWLVVAGEVFQGQSLIALIAGVSTILVPVWYIWLGLRLRKAG